ncbi:MAG: N-acetyltransferase [marine bacterium B5-7]|nr:MAG: N-acetyltransferase [marine bacterium B5-7]
MLPTFETERLIVRQRSIEDLEHCIAMDRDKFVTQYIPGPWAEPEKHRAFVLDRINCKYPDGLGYWSVITKDGLHDFSGWILLLPYEVENCEIEIGWRFVRRFWGQGFATEAASAVLAYGINTLGLKCIVADIDSRNLASVRVAEKIGMQFAEDRYIDGISIKSYQVFA